MENLPPPAHGKEDEVKVGRVTLVSVGALGILLVLCLVFAWTTRDAMQHLPSTIKKGSAASAVSRNTLVDQSPWQTAQALAPLAVTAEENEFAREAERLADHEVDQAFAAALREATLQAQHRTLTGNALAISQKVTQLQQVVAQDQAAVQQLQSNAPNKDAGTGPQDDGSDLEIAKAQLGLDSDELADANDDLDRESGDERSLIQSELSAHEASMKKFDGQQGTDGQVAVISAASHATLAGRLGAWNRQSSRLALIQEAGQRALADAKRFTDQHNSLESQANANSQNGGSGQDRSAQLANIKDRSAQRQLLSIYDDRIQTEQRLAAVYQKWAAQVQLQHRILLHLILQSVAWILLIVICMVLGDVIVRRVMEYPVLDRRQRHTLRSVFELAIQVLGILCILFVIFGAPQQTTTILGLATAALTIALQDFVVAFFGWFVLMGKRGMRVGDTVEINGVGGEVTEIGLMSTTLLETGPLASRGYPTGRRITFTNSFAIRGQYFNFSTTGQWMLDQFEVTIPASDETHVLVEEILKSVEEETADNARLAEQEWQRSPRTDRLREMRASPSVNLRPAGQNFDVEVRYVTRASNREDTRNRLYRRVIDLLHRPDGGVPAGVSAPRPAPGT